jgi:hypothetical protein
MKRIRKEVKIMKYEQPEIAVLGSAVEVVQDSLAKQASYNDGSDMGTPTAYSSDEE